MEWIILYTQVDNSILSLYIFPCTGIQKRTKFATWNKKNYLILKIIEWHEKKYKLVTVMYAYIGYYTDCNGTTQLQLFQTPTGEARTRSNRYPWEPFGSCRLLEIFIFRPDKNRIQCLPGRQETEWPTRYHRYDVSRQERKSGSGSLWSTPCDKRQRDPPYGWQVYLTRELSSRLSANTIEKTGRRSNSRRRQLYV